MICQHSHQMDMSPKRGAFVVIEGLDRSGKSTQASAILSRLQQNGIKAKLLKFPGASISQRTEGVIMMGRMDQIAQRP
jgi:thymidylate kinase